MKIVFSNYDDPRNPWYAGGGARAIHEVSRRLAGKHQVTVITGSYPGAVEGRTDAVQYRRLGGGWAGPKLGQLCFSALLPVAVRRTPHDVWVESLTPPFSTGMTPWFTGRPVTALTQIFGGLGMRRKYGLPFDRVERWGLLGYRHAIALSQVIRSQLLAANPRLNVAVIPNGVPDELIARDPVQKECHVLFVGRIDREQKGLDLLLPAWRAVNRPGLPLVIAGSGRAADEAWLKEQLRPLTHIARMAGHVADERKLRIFDQAAFLVLPSRFEGFPLTLVEAFAHGLPVICFGIPELAWLPDSCCLKVPPFDGPALTAAMQALLEDPERRRSMGRAAKRYSRDFGWDAIAGRYEDFLIQITKTAASDALTTDIP